MHLRLRVRTAVAPVMLVVACGGSSSAVADGGSADGTLGGDVGGEGVDAGGSEGGLAEASGSFGDGAMAVDAPSDVDVPVPEAGPDVAVDDGAASRRIVFLTSVAYSAALGGLGGADAKCQTLAEAAGLPGLFKAWLSDANTAARDRLTHPSVPYQLVDGTVVASNWNGLTSGGMLAHAIDRTEKGGPPPGQPRANCLPSVWTETDVYGGIQGAGDCSGWTATPDAGTGTWLGFSNSTYPTWTAGCFDNGACSFTAPLYCLEQ